MDRLLIVISAYNESENLQGVVSGWYKILKKYSGAGGKLIIVDDGSTDATLRILKDLKKNLPELVILSQKNTGHGAAILRGYKYAVSHGADFIFQTDSDGQTQTTDFAKLWRERKKYDMVAGERVEREDGFSRKIVTRVLRLIVWLMFGVKIRDTNVPFRLMNTATLKENLKLIPEKFFLSNVLLSVVYVRKNMRVKTVPITFRARQGGKNSINIPRIFRIGCSAIKDFKRANEKISEAGFLAKTWFPILSYLFFGVCTTIINVLAYSILTGVLGLSNVLAASIAWLAAVAFAYVTNRTLVFRSFTCGWREVLCEGLTFFGTRAATGVVDIVLMYVLVDKYNLPGMWMKILTNLIVIILNFILSKLVIFRRHDRDFYGRIATGGILTVMAFILANTSFCGLWKSQWLFHADAMVYKYFGAAMLERGDMPYRDMFDHKGPVIYLINALGISIDWQYGILLLEFITLLVAIIFFYKTCRLLGLWRGVALLATLAIASTMTAGGGMFLNGGGRPGEYALVPLSGMVYVFVDYFKNGRMSRGRLFLLGVGLSMVLMMKVNYTAAWAVFALLIIYECVRDKEWKKLLQYVSYVLLGVSVVMIPLVIWLIINGAWGDFIRDYIIFNMTYISTDYETRGTWASRMGVAIFFISQPLILMSLVVLIFRVVHKREKLDIYCLLLWVAGFMMACLSGSKYRHYGMHILPGMIYPLALATEVGIESLTGLMKVEKKLAFLKRDGFKNVIRTFGATLLLATVLVGWPFAVTETSVFGGEDSKQQEIIYASIAENAREIADEFTEEGDEVVVYGNFAYFYLVTHRWSATRFPYALGITKIDREFEKEFLAELAEKQPKLIIDVSIDGEGGGVLEAFAGEYGYRSEEHLLREVGTSDTSEEDDRDMSKLTLFIKL